MGINHVMAWKLLVEFRGHGRRQRNRGVPGGDVAHVARHDAGFAGQFAGGDQALGVDGHDGGFVRSEIGQLCHVPRRAIGIMRGHDQLLARPAGSTCSAGAREIFINFGSLPSVRCIPVAIQVRNVAYSALSWSSLNPPPCGSAPDAFRNNRLLSAAPETAPTARVLHDGVVIRGSIEAQQREGEAILPPRFAMAGAELQPALLRMGSTSSSKTGRL